MSDRCRQCNTDPLWRSTPRYPRDSADLDAAQSHGHRIDATKIPYVIWTEALSCECQFAARLRAVDDALLERMSREPVRDDPDVLLIARHELRRRAYRPPGGVT